MRNKKRCDVFILWKIVEVWNYHSRCRWTNHGAKTTRCGDGVSLTFLAVMRCSLIFFAVFGCLEYPHVSLLPQFRFVCLSYDVTHALRYSVHIQIFTRIIIMVMQRRFAHPSDFNCLVNTTDLSVYFLFDLTLTKLLDFQSQPFTNLSKTSHAHHVYCRMPGPHFIV